MEQQPEVVVEPAGNPEGPTRKRLRVEASEEAASSMFSLLIEKMGQLEVQKAVAIGKAMKLERQLSDIKFQLAQAELKIETLSKFCDVGRGAATIPSVGDTANFTNNRIGISVPQMNATIPSNNFFTQPANLPWVPALNPHDYYSVPRVFPS